LFFLAQCSSTTLDNTSLLRNSDTIEKHNTIVDQTPPNLHIDYQLIATKDNSEWLRSLPSGDTLDVILALNRIDRSSLLKIDTLIMPDTIGIGIELFSPYPENIDELHAIKKILLVSYYTQAFAVYENGMQIRWGPGSLGKQSTPTPIGLFSTNWKSKSTISTVDSSWVMDWYFNIANFRGVSMHQYSLPGYPASHACIRLYEKDAYWLYYWADQWVLDGPNIIAYGTPVFIFGTYPFGQQKPWLLQVKNNQKLEVNQLTLIESIQKSLPIILERQTKRDSLEKSHL